MADLKVATSAPELLSSFNELAADAVNYGVPPAPSPFTNAYLLTLPGGQHEHVAYTQADRDTQSREGWIEQLAITGLRVRSPWSFTGYVPDRMVDVTLRTGRNTVGQTICEIVFANQNGGSIEDHEKRYNLAKAALAQAAKRQRQS